MRVPVLVFVCMRVCVVCERQTGHTAHVHQPEVTKKEIYLVNIYEFIYEVNLSSRSTELVILDSRDRLVWPYCSGKCQMGSSIFSPAGPSNCFRFFGPLFGY